MDALNSLGEIARDILMAVSALTVVLVLVVAIAWRFRHNNALKRLFRLLGYRIAATLVAGLFAIPIEPIPIADAVYDLGMPVVLIWYWLRLFRDFHEAPVRRLEHRRIV
jgi:uncharacterized membrane protein YfcA